MRNVVMVGSAMLFALLSIGVNADPVVMQNDSVVDFGQVAVQAGFVAGERGAAWLTSTCDGPVTAVQILWLSVTGGSGDTLGESVEVFEAGTFPVPGPRLLELLGPVVTDGVFNQFPIVPPIPVATGETLVVSFKFLSSPPTLGPSLVTDVDGCQPGTSGIFAIPPSQWFSACALGVSGDIAIRMVVDCPSVFFADGFETGTADAWEIVAGD